MRFWFNKEDRLVMCDGPAAVQAACAYVVRGIIKDYEETGDILPMTPETLHMVRREVSDHLYSLHEAVREAEVDV